MPDSDITRSDSTGPTVGKGKRSRQHGEPQPLTVFTGSHGLQADKPGAGKDSDEPDDTATSDPDAKPDLRR